MFLYDTRHVQPTGLVSVVHARRRRIGTEYVTPHRGDRGARRTWRAFVRALDFLVATAHAHLGERGLGQVQYVFLELPKYTAGDAPESLVDKWAYFFREAKGLDVVPVALSAAPFREALDVARATAFSPEEWDTYERTKMAEQDQRGSSRRPKPRGSRRGGSRDESRASRGPCLRSSMRAGSPPRRASVNTSSRAPTSPPLSGGFASR